MRQPEIEAMDRGELELLQLERLQSTLTRAYRQVKFYRRRFDQLGLNLDDIRSLNDLARLPCTTRDDLSENYPTACSRCRSGTSSASCPPPAPRKSPWWWAMPPRT